MNRLNRLNHFSIGGGGGAAKPNGAPSNLILTVLSDTSIKLDWTIGSTNQDGHVIEYSADGLIWVGIDTVLGVTTTYTELGLTEATKYYYRVAAYKGSQLSAYSNTASDYTAKLFTLNATGTGAGVSTVRLNFATTDVVVTLSGNGKFYSDAAGTLNESASYTFIAGALRTRYVKVTSGSCNMLLFAKNNWVALGTLAEGAGWQSATNGPSCTLDITNLYTIQSINLSSGVIVSGSVTALTVLQYLYAVTGTITISGSITALTSLTGLICLGANTLSGDVSALKSLTRLNVTGTNTILGELGGADAVVTGITELVLSPCRMTQYTSGATWSLTLSSSVNPSVGYGYSATEIDNMIIDMAASLGTVTAKTITLKGSSAARTSASDAAVATLSGKGWTVSTN